MTLYARSDVAATNVPAENGGCGQSHSRPVIDGAPQHPWNLNCHPCENYLRVHMADQWSVTTSEIPETHDETKVREDFDKRGAKDRDNLMLILMANAAGVQLPASLTRMISGVPAHVPATTALLECPGGHAQPAGMKFCGECGQLMSQPAAKASLPGPRQPAQPPAPPADGQRLVRMRDGRNEVLRAFARANGLDDGGKRPDLISRLSNAGLTGKFSAFNAAYQPGAAAA